MILSRHMRILFVVGFTFITGGATSMHDGHMPQIDAPSDQASCSGDLGKFVELRDAQITLKPSAYTYGSEKPPKHSESSGNDASSHDTHAAHQSQALPSRQLVLGVLYMKIAHLSSGQGKTEARDLSIDLVEISWRVVHSGNEALSEWMPADWHETVVSDDGVATMRARKQLSLKPGEVLELKPQGLHAMLMSASTAKDPITSNRAMTKRSKSKPGAQIRVRSSDGRCVQANAKINKPKNVKG